MPRRNPIVGSSMKKRLIHSNLMIWDDTRKTIGANRILEIRTKPHNPSRDIKWRVSAIGGPKKRAPWVENTLVGGFRLKWLLLYLSKSVRVFLICSPLSKSMRNWHGWLGISSWRWPTIQGTCTVLEGRPIWAVVVMMMMMMMTMMEVMRRIQRQLLAISQGRVGTIDYLQSRHICTQHTTFSLFVAFLFLFSFTNIWI